MTEICSVANGASKKEIGRAKEFIVKQLEEEMGKSMEMGTIHAGDFLVNICVLFFWLKKYIEIFLIIIRCLTCLFTEEVLLPSRYESPVCESCN